MAYGASPLLAALRSQFTGGTPAPEPENSTSWAPAAQLQRSSVGAALAGAVARAHAPAAPGFRRNTQQGQRYGQEFRQLNRNGQTVHLYRDGTQIVLPQDELHAQVVNPFDMRRSTGSVGY